MSVSTLFSRSAFSLVFFFSLHSFGQSQTSGNPPRISVRKNLQTYLQRCGVDGSVTVFDLNQHLITTSDSLDYRLETLPASTFKIINMLIALETGVIGTVGDIVKWPGQTDTVKYGYRPDIYHDITVADAFRESAGWAFIELAKRIGRERYAYYLEKCNYGNGDLSIDDPDFWNQGSFGVSPLNQITFLKELYYETLPFKKDHMQIVKEVMAVEENDSYVLRGKTGWTREGGINTGWWVGMIETNAGPYIFCTRLIQDRKFKREDFGSCRKSITSLALADLGIIQR